MCLSPRLMTAKFNSFKKEERLCSKKSLTRLFQSGSSFLLYPFRVTWCVSPDINQQFPIQIVIAVPKKRFKSAVDRNLIKRRIRESYRLSKDLQLYPALNSQNIKILLALSYVGKEIHEFDFIDQKLLAMVKILFKNMEK